MSFFIEWFPYRPGRMKSLSVAASSSESLGGPVFIIWIALKQIIKPRRTNLGERSFSRKD
jgi:hypothetical protein